MAGQQPNERPKPPNAKWEKNMDSLIRRYKPLWQWYEYQERENNRLRDELQTRNEELANPSNAVERESKSLRQEVHFVYQALEHLNDDYPIVLSKRDALSAELRTVQRNRDVLKRKYNDLQKDSKEIAEVLSATLERNDELNELNKELKASADREQMDILCDRNVVLEKRIRELEESNEKMRLGRVDGAATARMASKTAGCEQCQQLNKHFKTLVLSIKERGGDVRWDDKDAMSGMLDCMGGEREDGTNCSDDGAERVYRVSAHNGDGSRTLPFDRNEPATLVSGTEHLRDNSDLYDMPKGSSQLVAPTTMQEDGGSWDDIFWSETENEHEYVPEPDADGGIFVGEEGQEE